MQKNNIQEELLKLENKLLEKIHSNYKDAVNLATNKMMWFMAIISILLIVLGGLLGNYINNKYQTIKEITVKYEDAKVLDNIINLQKKLEKYSIFTGNINPIGNIMPDYVGQTYIRLNEDESLDCTYISTSICRDCRVIGG